MGLFARMGAETVRRLCARSTQDWDCSSRLFLFTSIEIFLFLRDLAKDVTRLVNCVAVPLLFKHFMKLLNSNERIKCWRLLNRDWQNKYFLFDLHYKNQC